MGGEDLDVDGFLASVTKEEWSRLTLRLTRYAFAAIRHRSKSWHEAEDLAQTAFLTVIDPKLRTWQRREQPDFFEHLALLVRKEASRTRMMRRRHRETEYEEDDANDDTIAGTPETPSHEAELVRTERGLRVLALVREKAPKADLLLRVVDLLEAHIDTMAEQAAHLGCTMMEVRNARIRLARLVKKIEMELDAEGEGPRGK